MPDNDSTKLPATIRRRSDHRLLWVMSALFLLTLGALPIIPWDAPIPEAPDLEITPPAIPETENAFPYIEAAQELQVESFPPFHTTLSSSGRGQRSWTWSDLLESGGPWDPKEADSVLAANAPMFAALEKGLACQRYAGPVDSQGMMPLPILRKTKVSIQLLCLKSRRAQLAGNDPEAVQTGIQALKLGRLITTSNVNLMDWNASLSCQAIALSRLEDLVSTPSLPAPQLREILATLEPGPHPEEAEGLCQAARNDYQAQKQIVATPGAPWPDRWSEEYYFFARTQDILNRLPYFKKPRLTLQWLVPCYRTLLAEANTPLANVHLDYPGRPREPNGRLEQLFFILRPNSAGTTTVLETLDAMEYYLERKCLIQAWKSALRLKIALRLYEKRRGQLPEELSDLIPEDLPALPADPYDGQSFRYSQAEKKIWSIGRDRIDQGGHIDERNPIAPRKGYDAVMKLETRETHPRPFPPSIPARP